MKPHSLPFSFQVIALLVLSSLMPAFAADASAKPFVVANDDNPFANSITLYSIGQGGVVAVRTKIYTGGTGIGGGYFGMKRVLVTTVSNEACVYAANTFTGDIFTVLLAPQQQGSRFHALPADAGSSNGVGLAMNSSYLYASYSDTSNIATFQVQPGCTLSFVNDVSAVGLAGGMVSGMAVHGNLMVVAYTDGTIESFDISLGTPVSNGDKQKTTAGAKDTSTYANDVDITQDGHYAIFGDTSTSITVEVSDISANKLSPTVAYRLPGSINSSNIMLSPDEKLLYISNTQGDTISAANFDAVTGTITRGCTSRRLRLYGTNWSYLGGMVPQQIEGNGAGVYVAEFGPVNSVAMVNLTTGNGSCTMLEDASSPVYDPNSLGLLSIGRFPSRSF